MNSLNIPCAALTGNISFEEADEIYRELYKESPIYKIIFITPEKISMSVMLFYFYFNKNDSFFIT